MRHIEFDPNDPNYRSAQPDEYPELYRNIDNKGIESRLQNQNLNGFRIIEAEMSSQDAQIMAQKNGWIAGFVWFNGKDSQHEYPDIIDFVHDDSEHAPYAHLPRGSAC